MRGRKDPADEADHYAEKAEKAEKPHILACFIQAFGGVVEAPEFVIDDLLIAGTVVIAGERGLGKTSVMVPLLMCVTWLMKRYPLTASIRRKVVYIAEDVSQVRRIIAAMVDDGMLDPAEVDEWFKIVETKRLAPEFIVGVVPHLDALYTLNERADGGTYSAPPVVCIDTTNATIDLANISDNSEVSRAVSTLREAFGSIPLALIGHVSKATRQDAAKLSFVGAGSWEGDTQQSLYLTWEDDKRYLILGKKRFEADATEYLIQSHCGQMTAQDKLGREVTIKCFYGVPEATTREAREEAKHAAAVEQKQATQGRIDSDILKLVGKQPGITKAKLERGVGGNRKQVSDAVTELVEEGLIRVEHGPNRAQKHYPVNGDTGRQNSYVDGSPF